MVILLESPLELVSCNKKRERERKRKKSSELTYREQQCKPITNAYLTHVLLTMRQPLSKITSRGHYTVITHLTAKITEAKRNQVTCPRLHS